MHVPFFTHHGLRTVIAKNTTAQILGKLFTSASVFLVSITVARLYGSTGYGEFSKITTYVPLFYLFSDFGFNAIYLQEGSNDSSKITWQVLLAMRITSGLALSAVALLLIALLPTGLNQGYTPLVKLGILINLPSILFQSLITTGNVLFQKNLRYDLSAVAVSLGSLVLSIFVFVAPQFVQNTNLGILVSIIFFVFSAATMALLSLYFARRFTNTFVPDFNVASMKSLFFRALPLGLTLVANLVYFRIDSIILTLTRSTEEVGFYGLAYKFFEFPLVLPVFFMNAIYPVLLTKASGEAAADNIRNILVKSAKILFVTGILTTCLFWIGAPLLSLVRGEFASATPYLRTLSLGLPFFFLSNLTMWTLITLKQTRTLLIIYTGATICTVIASAIIIPVHGAMGASVLTVVSEAALLVISTIYLIQLTSHEKQRH